MSGDAAVELLWAGRPAVARLSRCMLLLRLAEIYYGLVSERNKNVLAGLLPADQFKDRQAFSRSDRLAIVEKVRTLPSAYFERSQPTVMRANPELCVGQVARDTWYITDVPSKLPDTLQTLQRQWNPHILQKELK